MDKLNGTVSRQDDQDESNVLGRVGILGLIAGSYFGIVGMRGALYNTYKDLEVNNIIETENMKAQKMKESIDSIYPKTANEAGQIVQPHSRFTLEDRQYERKRNKEQIIKINKQVNEDLSDAVEMMGEDIYDPNIAGIHGESEKVIMELLAQEDIVSEEIESIRDRMGTNLSKTANVMDANEVSYSPSQRFHKDALAWDAIKKRSSELDEKAKDMLHILGLNPQNETQNAYESAVKELARTSNPDAIVSRTRKGIGIYSPNSSIHGGGIKFFPQQVEGNYYSFQGMLYYVDPENSSKFNEKIVSETKQFASEGYNGKYTKWSESNLLQPVNSGLVNTSKVKRQSIPQGVPTNQSNYFKNRSFLIKESSKEYHSRVQNAVKQQWGSEQTFGLASIQKGEKANVGVFRSFGVSEDWYMFRSGYNPDIVQRHRQTMIGQWIEKTGRFDGASKYTPDTLNQIAESFGESKSNPAFVQFEQMKERTNVRMRVAKIYANSGTETIADGQGSWNIESPVFDRDLGDVQINNQSIFSQDIKVASEGTKATISGAKTIKKIAGQELNLTNNFDFIMEEGFNPNKINQGASNFGADIFIDLATQTPSKRNHIISALFPGDDSKGVKHSIDRLMKMYTVNEKGQIAIRKGGEAIEKAGIYDFAALGTSFNSVIIDGKDRAAALRDKLNDGSKPGKRLKQFMETHFIMNNDYHVVGKITDENIVIPELYSTYFKASFGSNEFRGSSAGNLTTDKYMIERLPKPMLEYAKGQSKKVKTPNGLVNKANEKNYSFIKPMFTDDPLVKAKEVFKDQKTAVALNKLDIFAENLSTTSDIDISKYSKKLKQMGMADSQIEEFLTEIPTLNATQRIDKFKELAQDAFEQMKDSPAVDIEFLYGQKHAIGGKGFFKIDPLEAINELDINITAKGISLTKEAKSRLGIVARLSAIYSYTEKGSIRKEQDILAGEIEDYFIKTMSKEVIGKSGVISNSPNLQGLSAKISEPNQWFGNFARGSVESGLLNNKGSDLTILDMLTEKLEDRFLTETGVSDIFVAENKDFRKLKKNGMIDRIFMMSGRSPAIGDTAVVPGQYKVIGAKDLDSVFQEMMEEHPELFQGNEVFDEYTGILREKKELQLKAKNMKDLVAKSRSKNPFMGVKYSSDASERVLNITMEDFRDLISNPDVTRNETYFESIEKAVAIYNDSHKKKYKPSTFVTKIKSISSALGIEISDKELKSLYNGQGTEIFDKIKTQLNETSEGSLFYLKELDNLDNSKETINSFLDSAQENLGLYSSEQETLKSIKKQYSLERKQYFRQSMIEMKSEMKNLTQKQKESRMYGFYRKITESITSVAQGLSSQNKADFDGDGIKTMHFYNYLEELEQTKKKLDSLGKNGAPSEKNLMLKSRIEKIIESIKKETMSDSDISSTISEITETRAMIDSIKSDTDDVVSKSWAQHFDSLALTAMPEGVTENEASQVYLHQSRQSYRAKVEYDKYKDAQNYFTIHKTEDGQDVMKSVSRSMREKGELLIDSPDRIKYEDVTDLKKIAELTGLEETDDIVLKLQKEGKIKRVVSINQKGASYYAEQKTADDAMSKMFNFELDLGDGKTTQLNKKTFYNAMSLYNDKKEELLAKKLPAEMKEQAMRQLERDFSIDQITKQISKGSQSIIEAETLLKSSLPNYFNALTYIRLANQNALTPENHKLVDTYFAIVGQEALNVKRAEVGDKLLDQSAGVFSIARQYAYGNSEPVKRMMQTGEVPVNVSDVHKVIEDVYKDGSLKEKNKIISMIQERANKASEDLNQNVDTISKGSFIYLKDIDETLDIVPNGASIKNSKQYGDFRKGIEANSKTFKFSNFVKEQAESLGMEGTDVDNWADKRLKSITRSIDDVSPQLRTLGKERLNLFEASKVVSGNSPLNPQEMIEATKQTGLFGLFNTEMVEKSSHLQKSASALKAFLYKSEADDISKFGGKIFMDSKGSAKYLGTAVPLVGLGILAASALFGGRPGANAHSSIRQNRDFIDSMGRINEEEINPNDVKYQIYKQSVNTPMIIPS